MIQYFRDLLNDIRSDPQNVRAIRFAIGITLSVAFSAAINWPLAFLVPILTATFLATPMQSLSFVVGLACMIFTMLAFGIGLVFAMFLLSFPMVYFPMLVLVIFNLYYFHNRGGPLYFVLMSLLAILILPTLAVTHEILADGFASGFVLSGLAAIVMVWIAFFLVPDSSNLSKVTLKKKTFQKAYSLPAAQAALKSTVVVVPLAMLFISYKLSDLLVVLIFTAIFSLAPDVSKGKSSGIDSLRSTLVGGAYAFIVFFSLVAVPEYHFFVAVMLLITLIFGRNIFSDRPIGKYYAAAFSTMYILVSTGLNSESSFTSAFAIRYILILLATFYVVYSILAFERFWPQRQNK